MDACRWQSRFYITIGLLGLTGCFAGCRQADPPSPNAAQGAGKGAGDAAAPSTGLTARQVLERMVTAYQKAPAYFDQARVQFKAQLNDEKIESQSPLAVVFERPNRLRMEVYQAVVVADGKQLRAYITSLANQVLVRDQSGPLALQHIYSDRVLGEAISQQIAGDPPQLVFLIGENPIGGLLQEAEEPKLLEAGRVGQYACHRVAIKRPDGQGIFWIDQQQYLLRRVDYPTDGIRQGMSSQGKVGDIELVAEFSNAQFARPSGDAAFQMEIPAGSEIVKAFYPPDPGRLLGKKAPAFKFQQLGGESFAPEAIRDKVAVLDFWATSCKPCLEGMPRLQKVYEKYKDNPKVQFFAVSVDRKDVENKRLTDFLKELKVTIPILRDLENQWATLFMAPGVPTTFLLGADGLVQDFESGANPKLETELPAKIDNLLAGKPIYEKGVKEYQERLAKYLEAAQSPPDGQGPAAGKQEVPKAVIAPKSEPKILELKSLWKCTSLKGPGNLLVVPRAGGSPQIFVVDGWKAVAELDTDGKVVAQHDLKLTSNEAISFLRTYAGPDGSGRLFAVSANGMQQAHVYDDRWQPKFDFPPNDPEYRHKGIADALLANLDGQGPRLYIGYWESVGVHAVGLDGKRLWSNRKLEWVFRLAVTQRKADGKSELACANNRGTLVLLDAQGQPAREVSVGSRMLRYISAGALKPGVQSWCGLCTVGIGADVAIGFDLDGKELWSYDLPKGLHEQLVDLIVPGPWLPGRPGVWLLPGSDGSIHILEADGKLIDRFNYGASISGLATLELGPRLVLLVATPQALEAFEVRQK